MKKMNYPLRTRLMSLLMALVCIFGLIPTTAFAAADTIKLNDFGYTGVSYESAALGRAQLHQMYFQNGTATTVGFCGTKGGGMGQSLKGQTWGHKQEISDPTVITMMAYFYSHANNKFTDEAIAMGENNIWSEVYCWRMNAWVQAVIWRYKQGLLSDPAVACAEELMAVYNSIEGTHYTSIDEKRTDSNNTFRDIAQYVLELGGRGVWGKCQAYEYSFTGSGSSSHPASGVQKIILGDHSIENKPQEDYSLIVKKVDSSNPTKGLAGAKFHIESQNGSFSKDIVTGSDGTYEIKGLSANTYAVTETEGPSGYEIDNAGPQYVTLPSNGSNKVTVTFSDTRKPGTPETPGTPAEGSIRKVDADNPAKGLAGAIIKITGIDNNFSGTFMSREGGYITDIPWETLPIGSFVAEEVTPPENYSLSPDPTKVRQTFVWDGKPLARAEFLVQYSDGHVVGPNNGIYTTGTDGTVTVSGLKPNSTVVVSEQKAPTGYILDETPKNIVVRPGVANGLIFDNQPGTTLIIQKFIEGTENEPLSGVAFKVTDGAGAAVGPDDGVYYTDKAGEIVLSGIEPGTTVKAREIKTVDGFVLNGTPQDILIKGGEVQRLTFWNKRDCSLTILKQSTDKTPLTGAVFHVTDEDGAAIGTNNGRYTSDRNGLITITGLQPGQVLIVTEEKAPNGFVRDMTPKTIKIKQGVANSLIFENAHAGSLVINKRSSADKKTPLEGVTFKITTTSGEFLPDEDGKISSNGLYYTDENGQIVLKAVVGTLVVTEQSTIDGYVIHEANRTQTVEVKPDDTQTLYFYNDPLCSLTLTKLDSVTGKPVPNTEFTVKDGDGNIIGRYVTGKDGTVVVTGLIPGSTVVVSESRVPDGYVLNTTPQTIIIKGGSGNSWTSGGSGSSGGGSTGGGSSSGSNDLTFENDPKTTLTIEKYLETETGNQPLKPLRGTNWTRSIRPSMYSPERRLRLSGKIRPLPDRFR